MRNFIFSLILFLILLSSFSLAQVPLSFNYQGVLKDNAGNPLNGNYKMTFSIYTSEASVSSVWQEIYDETTGLVPVSNGLYSVRLGSLIRIDAPIFDGETKYLEVVVNGQTMSPRIALVSVPYALRAGTVAGDFVRLGPSQAQITVAPYGISIESTSTSPGSIGILSKCIGETTGIKGTSATGIGVHGYSWDTGVYGEGGIGIFPNAGIGVRGKGNIAGGSFEATSGIGVYAKVSSSEGYAGYFEDGGKGVKITAKSSGVPGTTAAPGTMIYDKDNNILYIFDGNNWRPH